MPEVRIDDALQMHYEDDDFTDPWKTPEVAVLEHCNQGSSRLYYRWAPVIARHYRFIRPDRRGSGRSSVPPPGYPWSLGGWAKDLRTLLDRLELDQIHLIGEATGAFVGVQFAADYPERVRSLTLINFANPRLVMLPGREERAELVKEGAEALVRKRMYSRFDPKTVDPEYIEWHAQEKVRQPQGPATEVVRYMATVDVGDALRRIRSPTLLIANEGSSYHPPAMVKKLTELIPKTKFELIKGVPGYVAHAAPELCAQVWLNFVRSLH